MKTALLIVDVQNDFLPAKGGRPAGSLPVPEGNDILSVINGLLDRDTWDWDSVIGTQDYHPPEHISFASRHHPHPPFSELEVTDDHGKTYLQTLWPDHCVQGTKGVEIETSIQQSLTPWTAILKIARKACYRNVEAYSGFEGYLTESASPQDPPADPGAREPKETDLAQYLRSQGVTKVVVTGLAADFWYVILASQLMISVKSTAEHSVAAGFDTVLLAPSTRAVVPEKVEGVYDSLEKRSVKVLGRDGKTWEEDLQKWMSGGV